MAVITDDCVFVITDRYSRYTIAIPTYMAPRRVTLLGRPVSKIEQWDIGSYCIWGVSKGAATVFKVNSESKERERERESE
jgi:hypothetical protein